MFVRGFNAWCGNSDLILKDSTTVVQGEYTISDVGVLGLVSIARNNRRWRIDCTCVYIILL